MSLNIVCALLFFALQIAINFFLAPFILKNLGESAYGFMVLCNSIVSWGYVFSSLVNAVAGRFVSFAYHKNEFESARQFYSSVVVANGVFCVLAVLLALAFVPFMDRVFKIDESLIFDVSLAFVIYALNFAVGLFVGIFGIHAFIKNKLYLISARQAAGALIMAGGIFGFYLFCKPMIAYVATAALISSFAVLLGSLIIIKRLNTGVCFSFAAFKISAIKAIASSGVLNSIQAVSNQVLLASVDLILVNAFLGSAKMGILALAKAVTMFLSSFVGTASNSFMPVVVSLYAKDDIKGLCEYLRFAMRLLCFITFTPLAVFVVLCPEFYLLWIGFRGEAEVLFIAQLAMISAVPALMNALMHPLFSLNIATNKQKRATIATLIFAFGVCAAQSGALFLGYGLYAVLCAASVLYVLKIVLFDVINAAVLLNLKALYFMGEFLRNGLICLIIFAIIWGLKGFLRADSWLLLAISGAALACAGYLLSFLFVFNAEQKRLFFGKIKAFLRIRK